MDSMPNEWTALKSIHVVLFKSDKTRMGSRQLGPTKHRPPYKNKISQVEIMSR